MPDKFLSNLEWMALSQSGRVREALERLHAEVVQLRAERDTLLAENSRLRSEMNYTQRVARVEPPAPRQEPRRLGPPPAPTQAPEAKEPEKPKENDLDDAVKRFMLLELD